MKSIYEVIIMSADYKGKSKSKPIRKLETLGGDKEETNENRSIMSSR